MYLQTLLFLRQPPGSPQTMSGNTNSMQIFLIIHCLFVFSSSYSLIAKSMSLSLLRSSLRCAVKPGSGQSGPLILNPNRISMISELQVVWKQVNKCFPASIFYARVFWVLWWLDSWKRLIREAHDKWELTKTCQFHFRWLKFKLDLL